MAPSVDKGNLAQLLWFQFRKGRMVEGGLKRTKQGKGMRV